MKKMNHKHDAVKAQTSLLEEISIDGFCGGGGWSTGFELAIGEPVTIGINHDADAIALHKRNHPYTKHYNENIYDVNPCIACAGRPVGWAHFSPDCKHFSRAKGAKPVSKKIRGLAWVIIKWAGSVQPRIISMENVPEFKTWGPLIARRDKATGRVIKTDGTIAAMGERTPVEQQQLISDPRRKGETFRAFVRELEKLGYVCEFRVLRACDYGAATSRTRLFGIFRRDGRPIVWPEPTHGEPDSEAVKSGKQLPWPVAADIIDWSKPCPSIFERTKPLAENTMARIARGIRKFVVENPEPFIVQINHAGESFRGQSVREPMPTFTAKNGYGVVTPHFMANNENTMDGAITGPAPTITTRNCNYSTAPVIASIGQTGTKSRASGINEPVPTIVSKQEHCLVVPTLIQYHTEQTLREHRGQSVQRPLQTIDTSSRYGLAAATLIQTGYGEREGQAPRVPGLDKPLGTIVSGGKHAAVTAFLSKYYDGGYQGARQSLGLPVPTVTATDHNAVITSNLIQLNNHCDGRAVTEPLPTVAAGGGHFSEVRALLIKFYGTGTGQDMQAPLDTITAKDRFGLVTIAGIDYAIVDIGLRMLEPRELYNAHMFPPDYVIDFTQANGKPYPKSKQTEKVGNSVPPPFAVALARANWPEKCSKSLRTMAELERECAV